jgi:8-amino-7-oxononanoate synthase
MKNLPKKLQQKLDDRKATNSLRQLGASTNLVDFSSNDYLGFSKSKVLFDKTHDFLINQNIIQNGATGSRLLSGNHPLYQSVETMLCDFHKSEAALIFNSGYNANVGFFSCVPQRGDIILYDEFIHASIRDGINLSHAKAYKFKHNNLDELERKCQTERSRSPKESDIYIVTESVFSMDGDSPNLIKLSELCTKHTAYLIVDEAHAVGVFGEQGEGLIQHLNLEKNILARLVTFGKGLGCHGAAILGNDDLKQYLVNFSRSFIYTTGLPPHALASIQTAYRELAISHDHEKSHHPRLQLHHNIQFFKSEIKKSKLEAFPLGEMSEGPWGFIESNSTIHCCIISGNEHVKSIAQKIQENGFDVKPILSPTVPKGQERLRFCLHSFNSEEEIKKVLQLLVTFVIV